MKTRPWLRCLPLLLLPLLTHLPSGQEAQPNGLPEARAGLYEPTVVFLLRHAEKGDEGGRDPGLSEVGTRRAEALAHWLSKAGVTHLISSEYERTKATLRPLSKALELEIQERSARDDKALAEELRALEPGSVVVVAGHSNTVPALSATLGYELPGLIDSTHGRILPEEEYGRLVQLVLEKEPGGVRLVGGLEFHIPD